LKPQYIDSSLQTPGVEKVFSEKRQLIFYSGRGAERKVGGEENAAAGQSALANRGKRRKRERAEVHENCLPRGPPESARKGKKRSTTTC